MADQSFPESSRDLAVFLEAGGPSDKSLALRKTSARIGQGPQNDIVIDDDTVSTNHARIDFANGSWMLTDLGSKNGTFISKMRLTTGVANELANNALVSFGGASFNFRVNDVDPAKVAAPVESATPKEPARSSSFRLPVWVLVLIIVILAIIAFALVTLPAEAQIFEPLVVAASHQNISTLA